MKLSILLLISLYLISAYPQTRSSGGGMGLTQMKKAALQRKVKKFVREFNHQWKDCHKKKSKASSMREVFSQLYGFEIKSLTSEEINKKRLSSSDLPVSTDCLYEDDLIQFQTAIVKDSLFSTYLMTHEDFTKDESLLLIEYFNQLAAKYSSIKPK